MTEKTLIFLVAFVVLFVNACEVYYLKTLEIICITDKNNKTAIYDAIYQNIGWNCDGKILRNYNIFPSTYSLRSEDCELRSRVFEGLSEQFVHTFTTGVGNPSNVIPNFTFHGVCALRKIVLKSANIMALEPQAFDCVESIQVLDMSMNQIEVLPPNIFWKMQLLKYLTLSFNKLKHLQTEWFHNLPKLENLYLDSNSISHLPDGIFRRLQSLQILSLDDNELETLGSYPFYGLPEFWHLSLRNNRLKTLETVFRQNHQLLTLNVNNNDIDSISKHVFTETKNLEEIFMNENRLAKITPEMFGPLQNLDILALASNEIKELNDEPFQNNSRLTDLDLRGNNLTQIRNGDFSGLLSLRTLILISNSIISIPANFLKSMPLLNELYLNSNILPSIHGAFSNTTISILSLADNKLKDLSNIFHNSRITQLALDRNFGLILNNDTLAGLTNLTNLYMNECNITSIPDGIFLNTPKLRIISLCGNSIQVIKPETFAFLKLEALDLCYNKIEQLSNNAFAKNEELLFLNISFNNISAIGRETFRKLSLKTLDLSSNSLKEFTAFAPVLTSLNISRNYFTSFPKVLEDSENLQIFDVHNNSLSDITIEQWRKILRLESFIANNNSIQEVFISDVHSPSNRSTIMLRHNRIRRIHLLDNMVADQYQVLKTNTARQNVSYTKVEMYLSDNPILCDCSAYNLTKFVKHSRNRIVFEDDLVCHHPVSLRGKKLKDLKPSELGCTYRDYCLYFQCIPPAYDCLGRCDCHYQPRGEFHSMNCSNKGFKNLPHSVPKLTYVLDMSHNNIDSLTELNQTWWQNLTEIHVQSNAIRSIEVPIPENVTFLGLRDNRLRRFPIAIQRHAEKVEEFRVTLSGNLWPCDCSISPLKDFLLEHKNKVLDIGLITCTFRNRLVRNVNRITYSELCPSVIFETPSIVMSVVCAALIVISVAVSIVYYKHKFQILSFLYTHCNGFYRVFCCDSRIEERKIFDGFISYGSDDRDVALAILEELEVRPPKFSFCIHERNWMPGSLIMNNIQYSVENSRKTLIVLSESFLASPWFQKEFHAAYTRTLQDKQNRMILILKGKLPELSELHEDLRYVLETNTYLEWGERWFFEKLRYALHEQKHFVAPNERSFFAGVLNFFRRKREGPQEDIAL